MAAYVCSKCGFRVPVDVIGVALMKQHLSDHARGET